MDSPSDKFSLCPTCRQIHAGEVLFCPRDGTRLDGTARILAGKFILGAQIGVGSMGAVFEAEQPAMGRKVAVKLLHQERTRDPMMVQRFEREARAAGKITHQNVITIYESGRAADGQVYLAMERLRGESLADLLQREGRLAPERALPLWLQAVRGTAAAHQEGVIHRDLKPENLFLAQKQDEGAEEQVKILDFGIAKLATTGPLQAGTVDGTILGTLQYMAPEQVEGRPVDPRADVYALGLILCEMLTGRLPWGADGVEHTLSMIYLRLMKPPLPLSDLCPREVPPEWQRLMDDALAIDPAQRPAHAGELLTRARQVLAAAPPPWPLRTQPELPPVPEILELPSESGGLVGEPTAVAQRPQATVPCLPTVAPLEGGVGPADGDRTTVNVALPGPEATAEMATPSLGPDPGPLELQEDLAPDEDRGEVTRIQDIVPEALITSVSSERLAVKARAEALMPPPITPLLGVVAALAGAAVVLLVWQRPHGVVPKADVRVVAADMAVSAATVVGRPGGTAPQDGGAAPDVAARTPPVPAGVLFQPRVPQQVLLSCPGRRPFVCGSKGCRLPLPTGWRCTVAAIGYQTRVYRQGHQDEHGRVTVELNPK